MTVYEICSLCLSAATVIAAIVVAGIYYFQLRAMRKQLATMEHTWSWQQKYDVLTWLHEISEDVECVLALAPETREKPWTEKERAAATNVCYKLHIIGALLTGHEQVEQLFANTWFYSVPRCHTILRPFIEDMRAKRDPNEQRYFSGFDRLVLRFQELNKSYCGFAEQNDAPETSAQSALNPKSTPRSP